MRRDDERYRTLKRTLQALRLMLQQPVTLAEIGAELGACKRTARRYVYALEQIGLDVERRERVGTGGGGTPETEYRVRYEAWIGLSGQPVERVA